MIGLVFVGLNLILAHSVRQFWNIINYFGNTKNIWTAKRTELLEVPNIRKDIMGKILLDKMR